MRLTPGVQYQTLANTGFRSMVTGPILASGCHSLMGFSNQNSLIWVLGRNLA